MPQFHEMASSAFLLLKSSALVGQVQARIKGLDQLTHVIIWHRGEEGSSYFLCDQRDLCRLAKASEEEPLFQALRLEEAEPTPTFDAHIDARLVPNRCIVLEGDWVVGFFDAYASSETRRGSGRNRQEIQPLLETEFPGKVVARETASLLVRMTLDQDTGEALKRTLPIGATIDVVVRPIEGFQSEGITEGNLVVSDPPALPLQFKLRAVKAGIGRLRVVVFYQGEGIGEVILAPTIVAEPFVGSSISKRYKKRMSSLPEAQPELSLWVFEKKNSDGDLVLDFRLSAADAYLELSMKRFGEVSLGSDFQTYVKQLFDSIDELSLRDERSREKAERELETQGAVLFERVLPERLRHQLLELRPRIRYFQIQSEEPWIPWELCWLWGKGTDGRMEESGFLCDRFAVTRWRPGIGQKPALSLQNLALIVPESDLPMAPAEKEFILSLGTPECAVCEITPTIKGVERALISGAHDGIHFTGHGSYWSALDREAIRLGEDDMSPEHITGLVANLGEAAPLVFLNACSTGRTYRRLNEIEGWAQRFLSVGCGAFIGTYWRTRDESCLTFTKEFYGRLLSGNTISEAVREARRVTRAKAKGDPTWLAYTVYAHPLAVLKRV